MPNNVCDHDQNRKKICIPCGKKIVLGKQKLEDFQIKEKYVTVIKKHANEAFDTADRKYPLAVCTTCRITLEEYCNNDFRRPFPTMPNYEDVQYPKQTRNNDENLCYCYICITARYKGHRKTKIGRGKKREFAENITPSNGLYAAGTIQLNCKVEEKKSHNSSIKLCTNCYSEIARGKAHNCKENIAPQNLVSSVLSKLPENQQEQIANYVLKKKADTDDNAKQDVKISLANVRGSKTKVVLNPVEKKSFLSRREFR